MYKRQAQYRAEARKWREQAFSFRGKNIQMITERCGDPEYWDKLDRNYETGINLGKLSPSELRALRRDCLLYTSLLPLSSSLYWWAFRWASSPLSLIHILFQFPLNQRNRKAKGLDAPVRQGRCV